MLVACYPVTVDTGSYLWPLRGLSRVLGNSHARFLGEWWSATAATYPINVAFILLIHVQVTFPMIRARVQSSADITDRALYAVTYLR